MLSEPNIYWNHVPKFLFRIFRGINSRAKDYGYVVRWIFLKEKENVGTDSHDDFAPVCGIHFLRSA